MTSGYDQAIQVFILVLDWNILHKERRPCYRLTPQFLFSTAPTWDPSSLISRPPRSKPPCPTFSFSPGRREISTLGSWALTRPPWHRQTRMELSVQLEEKPTTSKLLHNDSILDIKWNLSLNTCRICFFRLDYISRYTGQRLSDSFSCFYAFEPNDISNENCLGLISADPLSNVGCGVGLGWANYPCNWVEHIALCEAPLYWFADMKNSYAKKTVTTPVRILI